jgi:hypothetical protein
MKQHHEHREHDEAAAAREAPRALETRVGERGAWRFQDVGSSIDNAFDLRPRSDRTTNEDHER